ncbi:MAG: efflux RND transporter periplasmic adaptor subunit [Flavobacteriales bacterium]
MKKHLTILAVLVLVLLSCNKKKETIKPSFGRLNEAVYASGNVISNNQYVVYSPVTGIILEILVKEGDTIQEGDAIYRIDNKTLELNSDNARLALELTRDNSLSGSDKLRELELASESAREKYELDSSLYARQKKLWEQSIGSKVDFEQKELSLVTSRNNYFATKSKISEVKKQLRNELARAENNYAITQKQENDYLVRSLINGIVFEITKERGELISPQTALGVVGDASLYHLELEVDEYDVVRILPGQKIDISMDSRRGEVYEAVVTKVRPLMNERTRTFVVEASFTKAPPTLFPNLTVEANIILQTKENAFTIPREYLIENEFVMVDDEKRKVKTGLKDFNKIEILEGIDSSTSISRPETK